jgi:hypothetical protein
MNTKFFQKNLDPDELGSGINKSFVLRFSAGAGNRRLLTRTLRYEVGTKEDSKTSYAATIIHITYPVDIGKGTKKR